MRLKILQIKEAASDTKYCSTQAIIDMMAEEGKADRECFWVLHSNTAYKILEKELAHMGTLDCTNISPREVFRKAVINSSAAIITVHNHPSGEAEPSDCDKSTWDRLIEAGDILGIKVIDNIIISPSGRSYSYNG